MITYIVSTYLGPRRSDFYNKIWDVDIYYFVRRHIRKINELNDTNISKIVFSVNRYNNSIDRGIYDVIKEENSKIPVSVIYRNNKHFSYGAWNDAIKQIIHEPTDYYFLIEDDYIPNASNFYKYFVDEIDDTTGYVAQVVNYSYHPIHASISNGLLPYEVAKEMYTNHGDIFNLPEYTKKISKLVSYEKSSDIQIQFLMYISSKYKIKDVSKTTRVPFLNAEENSPNLDQVIYFGTESEPEIIVPAQLQHNVIEFKPITDSDAQFINKIRNGYASEFLHNSNTYTESQTKEWIKKYSPDYYIIQYLHRSIGYFRTSNYCPENRNIYIGCDIAPEFTGEGLGYISYLAFIPFIFKKYDLHKISLEVLSTNTRAISLYEKLGFVKEGVKREEVIKNGKYIDSIIYSLLKSEFKP